MLVDLHAHYPMRVVSDLTPDTTLRRMRRVLDQPTFSDKVRALVLRIASTFFSHRYPWTGYRVTVEGLRSGGVGVALSALTQPFDEMDLSKRYGSAPESAYFDNLIEALEAVEREVATHGGGVIRVVHDRGELDAAIREGATALLHSVEGGLSLGDHPDEVEANVDELARRGVVSITLAHLFYRQVATNSSALPFLLDPAYKRVFPQPKGVGLTERGVAAVRAMVRNRMLVDIAHMREEAVTQTLALLDELDPKAELPVLASHAGYRFGTQEYMLDEATILEIQRRSGLVGLILAQHQLNDGLRKTKTKTLDDSLDVIYAHIDRMAEITGGHETAAIGTDYDGFIRPCMSRLEEMGDLPRLTERLESRYGADAERLISGNGLRVLRQVWT